VKILFDEMMPEELAPLLIGHEVSHVVALGWRHITNGKLLAQGESDGFDALVTKDANLPFQQNLTGRSTAVLILRPGAQSLPNLLSLAPRILSTLATLRPATVTTLGDQD